MEKIFKLFNYIYPFFCIIMYIVGVSITEDPIVGLIFFLISTLVYLPYLKYIPLKYLLGTVVFIVYFLDNPVGRPFYEWEPFTETLGAVFYLTIGRLTSTSFSITLYEMVMIFLFIWVLYWKVFFEHKIKKDNVWHTALSFSFLIPVIILLALMFGLLNGGNIDLAVNQIRSIFYLSIWIIIGYKIIKDAKTALFILKIFTLVMFFKALLGIYAYFFVFNTSIYSMVEGHMVAREYLMDHLASDFLLTAMIFVIIYAVQKPLNLFKLSVSFISVCIMFLPYFLNDRRASFVGLILCILLIPVFIPYRMYKKYIKRLFIIGLVLIFLFIIFYFRFESVSRMVHSFAAEEAEGSVELGYRSIENFNLIMAVKDHPFFGLGFGHRFPMRWRLPDISFVYNLYDALPHNTFLFMWTFGGPLLISALSLIMAFAIGLSIRITKYAQNKSTFIFGFIYYTIVIRWIIFVVFDMGLIEPRILVMLGIMFGASLQIHKNMLNTSK